MVFTAFMICAAVGIIAGLMKSEYESRIESLAAEE